MPWDQITKLIFFKLTRTNHLDNGWLRLWCHHKLKSNYVQHCHLNAGYTM